MDYEEFSLGGMNAAWMRLKAPHGSRHAILYCHGGGYTSGNLGYARVLASKLAHVTGYDVLSFEYRLAPEHPYPAAVEDALRAWDHLMLLGYGARDVVLAGDSAGGNLALVLCHRLKAAGRRLPGALVLMSPWTDMTMSGASYAERAESDPMLTPEYIEAVRTAYAGGRDYASPDLSPLFADLTGFPPTLIQAGDHEILYSDAEMLCHALERAGVPCRFEVSEGMWHVFQMFPLRKAAAEYEHFCEQVGSLCHVTYMSSSAENITEEYYDTDSRLKTAQIKLERLQELLSKADNMADIITIESAISDTEYEIESLSGTLRHYDALVDYATVSLTLSETYKLDENEGAPLTFGARIARAFTNGLRDTGVFLEDLAIGIANNLVFLAVLAALAVVVVRAVRKKKPFGRLGKKKSKLPAGEEPKSEE